MASTAPSSVWLGDVSPRTTTKGWGGCGWSVMAGVNGGSGQGLTTVRPVIARPAVLFKERGRLPVQLAHDRLGHDARGGENVRKHRRVGIIAGAELFGVDARGDEQGIDSEG